MNATTCFSINPHTVYTFIDNESVLMGTDNETLYGLNEVGTEILKQLESHSLSLQAIQDYLLKNFDVTEAQCMADTLTFVHVLLEKQLIIQLN